MMNIQSVPSLRCARPGRRGGPTIGLGLLICSSVMALSQMVTTPSAQAADWPTYQHDGRRSAVTGETLSLPLRQDWIFASRHAPRPAWPPPAKADFWHHKRELNPRVIFDRAYHVAVADGRIFFGSSADDKVYALDAATGRELWTFFTGGPVRLAPTVAHGKVYVGSDDGAVYCLDAADGALVWRGQPVAPQRCVLGHGRMISTMPIRTGVVVDGGVAYCCAGIFPGEGVVALAFDANNGRTLWERPLEISPQGYMLVSAERLYVPTGRTAPVVLDRGDGKPLGSLRGSVGAYALVTADDLVVHGPGDSGEIALFRAAGRDHLATFPGLHMIIHGDMSYLHSKTQLTALDRRRYVALIDERRELAAQAKDLEKRLEGAVAIKTAGGRREVESLRAELERVRGALAERSLALGTCYRWEQPCLFPNALILAGGTLLAGGDEGLAAFSIQDGALLWQTRLPGRVYGLAVAEGRLFVSTDRGTIHCFRSEGSAGGDAGDGR